MSLKILNYTNNLVMAFLVLSLFEILLNSIDYTCISHNTIWSTSPDLTYNLLTFVIVYILLSYTNLLSLSFCMH